MPHAVIVGVDETPASMVAADWAAGEALSRGRPLRLLHVWSPDADAVTPVSDSDSQRHAAERLLHAVAGHVHRRHPDLPTEMSQLSGSPVEVLCDASADAELLVLGTRGLGGVAGLVAGSVSQAVLARVRRPVVVVRAPAPTGAARAGEGDVVLGLDTARPHGDVPAFAFDCAERYGCGVRLVAEGAVRDESELDDLLAPWSERHPGVPVTRHLARGRPAPALAEASRGARLLVVGLRRRRLPWGAHVGPTVHGVLRDAHAPVAVVPHD
ncbi:universal stress protein [Streptomyces sp. NPDC006368]|uniref:universal stress protein n=1 Tax=Streptomyces sp. NPDC006368 TaxID=3156760 RepID=UPI0033B35E84